MTLDDLSGDVLEVLGRLDSFDEQLDDEIQRNPAKRWSGKGIIDALFPNRDPGGQRLNVIPSGVPGQCQQTLLVAVATWYELKQRVLQAIEHVSVKCRHTTQSVVFYAFSWDARVWAVHRHSFRRLHVTCVLKMPFVQAEVLR